MTNKTYGIDYSKGKIYKIVCNITGLIYIGSTTKEYLSQRLTQHRGNYQQYLKGKYCNVRSFEIIKNNNYDIILLENVSCDNKDELRKRERYYIESLDCVNKNIPSRTLEEWTKQYYEKNREKFLESKKEYRIQNREMMIEKQKEKFICECGGKFTRSCKSKHEQSKKHKKYLSEVVEIFV